MEAYKRRMVIEYQELKERAEKLAAMLDKWGNGELDFMPKCPEYLLREQLATMKDYIGILQTRAKIENVDLTADVDQAGWIPVSERLPEEKDSIFAKYYGTDRWNKYMHRRVSDTVLVTIMHPTNGTKCVTTSHTADGQWRCNTLHLVDGSNIIAWMPLPEQYEEGKRNA